MPATDEAKPLNDCNWILIPIVLLIFLVLLSWIFRTAIQRQKARFAAYWQDIYLRQFDERMRPRKRVLFDQLHKMAAESARPLNVVEIGAGTGGNLQYYPKGTKVTCVDPNPNWKGYFEKNKDQNSHVEVVAVHGFAEKMEMVESSCADAVVGTMVMCSVHDVDKALSEVRRILKPGGKYLFLDHVAAKKGTLLYYVQVCFTRLLALIGHGHGHGHGHLMRQPQENIKEAGFSSVECDYFHADEIVYPISILTLGFMAKPHVMGVATK